MHPLLAHLHNAHAAFTPSRFVRGLVLPFRAAAFVARQPRLWPFVVIPALINMALFAVAAGLVIAYAGDVLGWLWPRPLVEGVLDGLVLVLWYGASLVFGVVGLAASYLLVVLVGGIVASPFNDILSERTERLLTGTPVPETGETWWGGILKSIGSSAFITALYLLLLAGVLLLNLIPAVGSIVATVSGACLGAFFLSLEYSDNTFERYGFTLGQKIRTLRTHLSLSLGVGLGASFFLWIPLLNFLCIPIAVVCGTALALSLQPEPEA